MNIHMDEPRGLIFDIQRYSTHDGPGIRTTAFLKGCPLRCPWCHNPESISREPELLFWRARCIGCLACAAACPHGAISAAPASGPEIDRTRCRSCGSCAKACPSGALELAGRWVSAAELLRELTRDRAFYENSGGGVTFSGGEALLQPAFLLAALKLCKIEDLHTAVDTSGEVPWEDIDAILPYTDLFLYDVKPASSARVLDNLRRLSGRLPEGAAVQIRVPVIPGRNDTPEAIMKVSEIVRGHSVCLLPFHRLGSGKYAALGIDYPAGGLEPPDAATMAALADTLRAVAREVTVG